MPNQSLLRSLDFTKSVGKLLKDDVKFNDACEVGGFPIDQYIGKILEIKLYTQGPAPLEFAVIAGLAVTYAIDGNPPHNMPGIATVRHGIVQGEPVGTVSFKENEILVGASGKLKDLPGEPTLDGRISFISFTVFNKDTGLATVQGPFGCMHMVRESWGSYGSIIAFQGTVNSEHGLTSLGFTRLIQGVPEMGITGN